MIVAACLAWPVATYAAEGSPATGAGHLHFPDRVEKWIDATQGSPTTGAHAAPAPGSSQPPSSPYVRLGNVPVIKLGPQKPVSREEAVHIRWLIARLAAIDRGDFGLSPTLSGTVFAPLPGLPSPNAPMLANPDPQTPAALRELIVLGPRALPFLLGALDDRTPTRLVVRQSTWGAGSMEFGHGGS